MRRFATSTGACGMNDNLMKRNAIGADINPGEPLERCCNAVKLRSIAASLWKLLDDIDTASDAFKPREEESYKAFYKFAMKTCESRVKHICSDGYKLFLLPEPEPIEVLKAMYRCMNEFGDLQEGWFYCNRSTALELQETMSKAYVAITKSKGPVK